MADQRIKGQEVEVFVIADGQVQSFTDVNNFDFSQAQETKEEGYLGEKSMRYDDVYNGYTFSIGMHNSTGKLFDFLQILKDRAQRRTPGVVINIKATLSFPSGERKRVILQNAFFDATGIGVSGKNEYATTTIPGKGAEYRVL